MAKMENILEAITTHLKIETTPKPTTQPPTNQPLLSQSIGSTSKKQPTTEDTTMSQNSSIHHHHHNILNTNPTAILEEILQTNTSPEVQINKLTNALINTYTEAASQ